MELDLDNGLEKNPAEPLEGRPADESVIRELRPEDVPAILEIERAVFSDPWSQAMFEDECRSGSRSWNRVVVEADTNAILGYLVSWFIADEVHLANIAVVPRARRRGLADRLIRELEAEARGRRQRLILLEVRRSNRLAQALYRKHDFYTVSIRKRYYENREDALVMIKPLSESGRIPPADGV